jgi:hypothetical protein
MSGRTECMAIYHQSPLMRPLQADIGRSVGQRTTAPKSATCDAVGHAA